MLSQLSLEALIEALEEKDIDGRQLLESAYYSGSVVKNSPFFSEKALEILTGCLSDDKSLQNQVEIPLDERIKRKIRSLKRECAGRAERLDRLNVLVGMLRDRIHKLEWELTGQIVGNDHGLFRQQDS